MASYLPPLEDLPIFNDELFTDGEDLVTIEYANKHYLRFPKAQGTETLQAIIVNGTSQFNANINIGSPNPPNLTPIVNTYRTRINFGTSGQGSLFADCPFEVGGFGSITMQSSVINMVSNGRLNQDGNSTPNVLGLTNILTSSGQSGTTSLTIKDSVGNQGFSFLPNATDFVFNPAVSAGDAAMISNGGLVGTENMTIAPWSTDYCGLKLNGNGTASLGAGGTNDGRTKISLNGTDITFAANLDTNTTGRILLNSFGVVNNSSYTQAVQTNSTNPTTISSSTTECFVISSAVNSVVMDTFSSYLKKSSGGWTCKVINTTSSTINITTADADFISWLHPTLNDTYDIPPYNIIQLTALPQFITGLGFNAFLVEDCSGYRTFNSVENSTHYLNFSNGFGTGVGNIQKTAGITCNPFTNTITATTFNGTALSATRVTTTSDNTNGSYYVPFFKTTAGDDKNIFIDDTTGPFTYNPSNGGLTFSIGVCPRYDSSSNSANCSLFGNTSTGNIVIANAQTTGSITLGNNHTNGNVVIGSSTVVNGVVSVRPPLVLTRQLRTTNNSSYPPTIITDLGYINTIDGSSFTTSSLVAGTSANLYSFVFSSGGGDNGTYSFDARCLITPTNLTVERTIELSISTTSASIQVPYYTKVFSSVNGSVPNISISRTIQIYADTTVYLVARCSFAANIATLAGEGLFTFCRVA